MATSMPYSRCKRVSTCKPQSQHTQPRSWLGDHRHPEYHLGSICPCWRSRPPRMHRAPHQPPSHKAHHNFRSLIIRASWAKQQLTAGPQQSATPLPTKHRPHRRPPPPNHRPHRSQPAGPQAAGQAGQGRAPGRAVQLRGPHQPGGLPQPAGGAPQPPDRCPGRRAQVGHHPRVQGVPEAGGLRCAALCPSMQEVRACTSDHGGAARMPAKA